MIDNEVYKETTYEYGMSIVPEPKPEGNYQDFEWENIPEIMPSHDVVVRASYTTGVNEVSIDSLSNGCIYSLDGKKHDKLQKGLNIVVYSDGTIKKILF